MAVFSCFLGLIKTNSGSHSRNVRRSLSVLFATAIGISSQLVSAAPGDLLQRIDNPDAARNDFFGSHTITLPDGNIIVGAYLDDGVVNNSGTVYVFDQTGMLLQTIDNPSPGVSDFFGATMDFYNNELYVSSWRSDIGADDSGVIHVFDGTNFNFQRTIQNPTPEFRDGFGRVFAFSPNDDLFVAAPEDDNLERDDGAVYQINPVTGALKDTILNPEPGNRDRFGAALAVTPEGNIWVGAPNDSTTNINGGSAYLFDGATKELLLTLNNPTSDRDEYFGATILPYQNGSVAIAAYGYKGDGSTAGGRIYIYNAAGQMLRTVDNPSTLNIGGFGLYMVLDNNENIITRTNDTSATPDNEGALFRIDSDTGAIEQILVNPFHESPTYFAQHIILDTNNDLWISDQFQTNANGERGGATYKFEGVPTIPSAADIQPPVLYPPEEQLAESEFLSGAIVEYPYTFAADDVSAPLIANCFPASGSLFPIGVTEVTCSAQDSSGNVGTTSFVVNVLFKIANPIQTNSARFGSAIAINSAGNIIIGDYQQDVNLRSEGIIHEFTPEGTQLVSFENPEPSENSSFARSVLVTAQGNYLVTSPRNNFGAVNAGSVFLMDPNTGDVITTFRNPTPGTDEFFGVEVALLPNGDVVIANPSSDDLRANAGMVYVFNGTTGALLFDIPNPRVATSNQFGTQVATTPDGNILVSQHAGEFGGISEGFVYLFDGADGTLLRTFQAPEPQRSDNFGFDIQVAGNGNILVNAPGYDGLTESAGAVFVYNSNGDLLNTLAHPEPNDNEVFASYFDVIDDSIIAAYTPVWQADIRSSGLLYIMDTNTGELVKKIPNPTPERFEQFGRYVDVLPNGDLVIGADFDNRFGAVYIYDGSAIVAGGADTIPPVITTTGDLVIEATGPDGAIADFNVTATDNVAVVIGPDCLPLSGEIFPLGTTTVRCSAEDAAGNTTTETFNVTVVDTTPPELTVPQNVVVEATGPDGAIVDYLAADAFDLVGVESGPDCLPLSGQTYSLGETIVSCSASDAAGNEATGIFTIIVQDTTEPDTTIVSALGGDNNPILPGEFTLSDELTLEFSGSDLVTASENLVFSCRLDGGQWLPCSSPVTYQSLSVATHTIEVSATDEAGNNESSVATFSWSVVTAEDAIADAIAGLEVLLLDPASNQAGKKLENAIRKAQDAIDASQQIPINYTDVVRKIQQAVKQIDDAIRFGTAPLDAQPVLRQLTIVSREMAQSNIELALSNGGKPSKIANAQAQFAAANAEFANESYQAAIDLFLAASQEADQA